MKYKRSEIRENRQKWIDFLREPERKKTKNVLESRYDHEARCCLGHAAHLFARDRTVIENDVVLYEGSEINLSNDMTKMLGLYGREGHTENPYKIHYGGKTYGALSSLNDQTDITPQEIGEILQGMIEGGESTPFKPLSDYPE